MMYFVEQITAFVTHLAKNFQTTLHTNSLFPYFTPLKIILNFSSFQFPI